MFMLLLKLLRVMFQGRCSMTGLCLQVLYQQLGPKPNLSHLAEDVLLIITAEERIIRPKDPRQHILQTIRDTFLLKAFSVDNCLDSECQARLPTTSVRQSFRSASPLEAHCS